MGCMKSKVLDSEGIEDRIKPIGHDCIIDEYDHAQVKTKEALDKNQLHSHMKLSSDNTKDKSLIKTCSDSEQNAFQYRKKSSSIISNDKQMQADENKEKLTGMTFTAANRLARMMFFENRYNYIPEIRADTNGLFKINKLMHKSCSELATNCMEVNNEKNCYGDMPEPINRWTSKNRKEIRRASLQNGYMDAINRLAWITSSNILKEHIHIHSPKNDFKCEL